MSKSVATIMSIVLVVLGSVIAFNFLNKAQDDTNLNLISLNNINNTASYLWVDKKQDETTFYISGIEMESISSNSNPYFEVIFIIKDVENNSYNSNGFSFFSNIGSFSENTLRVSYNDLGNNDELEVKVKVNTNIVDEGNYFLDIQLNEGSFDLAEINNGVVIRLELPVNEKPALLKIWLNIFIVILLLSSRFVFHFSIIYLKCSVLGLKKSFLSQTSKEFNLANSLVSFSQSFCPKLVCND